MINYQQLLHQVLTQGTKRPDRTGTGTLSVFGRQLKFPNKAGPDGCFPAVTVKRLPFKAVCGELASFIQGARDIETFRANGCGFWDQNAQHTSGSLFEPEFEGDLGRIYGVQWRSWLSGVRLPSGYLHPRATDQLKNLVEGLKGNPNGRRHLVMAYNPGEMDQVCLPACHVLFQCYVEGDELDLLFWMRSVDLFLGLPCDIALYALLQRLIALECGLVPRMLVAQLGDCHIYLNHLEQAKEAVSRKPRIPPELILAEETSLFGFKPAHATLLHYDPHPPISAPMAQ